jgi:hypothetical protein
MARTHETHDETTTTNVNGVNTIADMFPDAQSVFARVIGGFTIPVPRKYAPGHVCSPADALALDMRRAQMLSATAQSNMERGAWSKLSDEEKLAKASDYATSYEFSSDVGASNSLLEDAVERIVNKLAEGQGVTLTAQARNENVQKILHTPALRDKYGEMVRSNIAAIMSERHEKRTRNAKGDTSGLEL